MSSETGIFAKEILRIADPHFASGRHKVFVCVGLPLEHFAVESVCADLGLLLPGLNVLVQNDDPRDSYTFYLDATGCKFPKSLAQEAAERAEWLTRHLLNFGPLDEMTLEMNAEHAGFPRILLLARSLGFVERTTAYYTPDTLPAPVQGFDSYALPLDHPLRSEL